MPGSLSNGRAVSGSLLSTLTISDQLFFSKHSFGPIQQSPFSCIHHAFESHVESHPQSLAVVDPFAPSDLKSITYSELDRQANFLARHLRNIHGVVPGKRVCLLIERSIFMIIGIVAILKSGASYIPLDGNIVADSTLSHIIQDSEANCVLSLRKFASRVISANATSICLDDVLATITDDECGKPVDLSNPDDSAYIVYTSGTTGVPKGVDVMHRNVTNLVCLAPGNIEMRAGRGVSQLMNVAFDMAAWEILGSLANGCTLFLRGKSSKDWRAVMKMVDVVIATPSMLFPHDPVDYPNIKVVAVAGEVCPQNLADKWASNGTHFYNSCGPTEITIVNTMVPHHHVSGESLSIGKPTPNNNVYVLHRDAEDLAPVAIGQPGIMWAGGAGITRGYLNLPDKTEERYKLDPFVNDGSLMFNTGDLGRWRPDGTLEHLGRIDDQVKIKGFRVELDGVGAAMETCSGVKAAVALLIDDVLWGFFTPSTVEPKDVQAAVAKIQPYYAVPSRFIHMEEFPNTTNGKVDKRALRRKVEEEIEVATHSDAPKSVATTGASESSPTIDRELLSKDSSSTLSPPPVYEEREISEKEKKDAPGLEVSVSALSSSSIEKGYEVSWAGYQDDDVPNKTQGKFVRNIRHQIFSLYRRLFGVVFVTNIAVLIATFAQGEPNSLQLGQIVIANLFCAILMRQDYVINAFFTLFCSVPPSWPMAIRRVCARVYSIGGLHSGCAISGTMWLVAFTVQATRELVQGGPISIPTVTITYSILLLLLLIIFFAYPALRTSKHDNFERTHRFFGWSCTALVWVQVVLLTNDYKEPGLALGSALVKSAPFWLVVIMTCSIILPWLRLRKVPVRTEVLSTHAIRLYFDYGETLTPVSGSFTRISESPLFEWHGFATIPEPGKKGYSLVVSRAGDWTSKQIADPPKELWVRGIPTCGVLRIVPIFRRIVLVATGSGIGPCTPCILEQRLPIKLLWTSPDVRKTFGDKLVDSILSASPDAVIYDTRKHGKPDMVKLTYRLVREFDAEAVCIISNQKLTKKVVYGMMSRGIPAFGAIWDS
ncbi:hypothetical protein PC9H_002344 [Pleurotus ostreatus]|uniref:AMP-dependent synthetase/ligase domain-containing protein n=1 Tax=Pleurotus ostreatus TaxID=5322 RepID=A0A8H7DM55_PLEOS|nr:uncharacterized protein PC9H_002344 [Pleurotus ostreatus]KAF7416084.1 hypothetical protein PC9H_002344 [Pleurotus ostreatus]